MSIYLIRHGKTLANEAHLYCGSTDLPLSPAGVGELEALHYDIHPARFVTSGMRRTDETLKALFGDVSFSVDARFREVDFGNFEMKSYDRLKGDPAYQAWIAGDNEANVPPHGESGAQMTRRALAAYRELPDGTALVCHGGVIAA
ncbi:MAG TPA: histidine phosphatase family protein, partial [Clostridiales bacterium]|nr:histidine phosphatase family protein [Clostridiales bacterium]